MILVLAESAIELVPREIWSHPAVASDARRRGKRPGEILLDRARHHPAMAGLEDGARRGRPDIVHQVLLVFQYSLLNRRGLGRVYIHTRGDYIIQVKPQTRIPKNYNNFVSLMEQLYALGRAPPHGDSLMELHRGSLAGLLEQLGGRWVVLHERGARRRFAELGAALLNSVVVVGGFPHGDFSNRWVLEKAEAVYSVGDEPLDAAQAVCRAVAAAEASAGLI
ncbi:ribosome biogenesis protein [Pyrobaculum neutrophilum]|uniref:Ribosomal RNA small subunit methyltransferase Nep1 n=1 Tax=Pyrobaculum neutrophilum (strain DSM 2338 / JCM 9278 / NBRC 100436 / V24Sta) TaxID=444157 RepID=NEP1_PYRNV|nr:ribosome biogenesis protein [Pyrobaculum neutrophilum]B1YD95.1 RecName: Full=Ribosomal RNA small subunit methyltransferase Nep1; AltName: Full=16S rRNA (pseudouridine-N1-)-methyltransferase Nep1 [Pyrobaculum neutrophilum V24Sta]ACB39758.1 Suppressor Mra1 family protein [Pyrobaculum neutrophilum V24Sta]